MTQATCHQRSTLHKRDHPDFGLPLLPQEIREQQQQEILQPVVDSC